MKAFILKVGYLALVLGGMALVFSSSGCSGHGHWQRPGWIIPR